MSVAYGKVILLGEHAVVYGTDAIAMSLDRRVTVAATGHNAHVLEIDEWNTIVEPGHNTELGQAYEALIAACHPVAPLRLRASLGIPASAGLGCSAALGTAIARALLPSKCEPATLFRATQSWESVFHGTPSGIDAWAAQGVGVFRFTPGGEPRVLPETNLPLVVCHSGSSGSTKAMVQSVAGLRRRDPRADGAITRIAQLVQRGARALENRQTHEFGEIMNENHECLQALGVSTDRLDTLCAAMREAGALGAKLTGSGGGGCALGLFDTREQADEIARALQNDHDVCFTVSATTSREREYR